MPQRIIRHDAGYLLPHNASYWPRTPTTAQNSGSCWTRRSPGTGLTIEQQRGTDLCTDVGVLHLADHIVPAGAVVSGISTERARCIAVALAACAAAGTVRRCADAAVDYIRTREQFGKPVGTFQALQHKAAELLVNAELAAAAAWDAVRASRRIRRAAPTRRGGGRPDGGGSRP